MPLLWNYYGHVINYGNAADIFLFIFDLFRGLLTKSIIKQFKNLSNIIPHFHIEI